MKKFRSNESCIFRILPEKRVPVRLEILSISRKNRKEGFILPPCARGKIEIIIDKARKEGPFCEKSGRQRRLTQTLIDRTFEGTEIDLVYSTAPSGGDTYDFSFKFQELVFIIFQKFYDFY